MGKHIGEGMVLTPRDVKIVQAVAECGALTGDQIRRHHRFGSVGRTNATLLRLVRHRYLTRRFQPTVVGTRRPIYLLDRAGVQLLDGDDRPRASKGVSDLFLQHQLWVNDVRFAFEDLMHQKYRFERWTAESELREMHLTPLPDGFAEYTFGDALYSVFIEVDRGTEGLKRFDQKVRAYIDLAFSGTYQRLFGRRFFRTLVLAPDKSRVQALRRQIENSTDKIFWLAPISDLLRSSPLEITWARPRSEKVHLLTET